MTCRICDKEFVKISPRQVLCSDECRADAKRKANAKYKKTDKGAASEMRWRNSDARTKTELRYRSKPEAKVLAVKRSEMCLSKNPHLQERKRIRDAEYARTEKGRAINNQATKKYAKTEKGKITQKNSKHNRRALEATGSVTVQEWQLKLKEYGGCCANCGANERIEMDHIYPLSKGGKHHIDNIQPLCRSCNASKGAKIEWAS